MSRTILSDIHSIEIEFPFPFFPSHFLRELNCIAEMIMGNLSTYMSIYVFYVDMTFNTKCTHSYIKISEFYLDCILHEKGRAVLKKVNELIKFLFFFRILLVVMASNLWRIQKNKSSESCIIYENPQSTPWRDNILFLLERAEKRTGFHI